MEENLTSLWNIAKTALGIGFVIFVHELGHFLLAKWNGVKVERFSIGFGRALISYRRGVGFRVGSGSRPPGPGDPPTYGETEYVLAVLPLGGYVLMLGESLENVADQAEVTQDPRDFNQKSVFARMQIITAGVIMNLILGVACFSYVYTQGWTDIEARIGLVMPGEPAYKAGFRPGDEIVAIDGRRDVGFSVLKQRVALSGSGQVVKFTIRRAGSDVEQTLAIEPVKEPDSQNPTIGVLPAFGLEMLSKTPFDYQPGQVVDPSRPNGGFEGGDKVIAIGPEGGPLEPVASYDQFFRKADQLKSQPIVVEVERTKKSKDGTEEKSKAKVTVPVHNFVDFGIRMTAGPIAAIRNDSPAQQAGFQAGDRIVAVDGQKDFDPMRLPDLARASAGKPMKLTIERTVEGKSPATLELSVTPDDTPAWTLTLGRPCPLDVPGLGLAIAIEPKIQAVADGSAAAKAGLKPGTVLKSMIITPKKREDQKSEPKSLTLELDGPRSGWPAAFGMLQQVTPKSIQVTIDSSKEPITLTPAVDRERFHPMRGFEFLAIERKFAPLGLTDSLRRGFDESVENVLNIGSIFRNLAQKRVGHSAFNGILPIAQVAYDQASAGWVPLIHFLGVLSINLAVINFLPIPPLDGGRFLFLTAEKVRGKPLPQWMLNYLMAAGVLFVLVLIVLVNGKDLVLLISSYF